MLFPCYSHVIPPLVLMVAMDDGGDNRDVAGDCDDGGDSDADDRGDGVMMGSDGDGACDSGGVRGDVDSYDGDGGGEVVARSVVTASGLYR
jgi:hypothetical protein